MHGEEEAMERGDKDADARERVNPAARRDRPGEAHGDLAERREGEAGIPEQGPPRPRGYQGGELDPRDGAGIAE